MSLIKTVISPFIIIYKEERAGMYQSQKRKEVV